jgi:hypothetical protein
MRNRSLGLGAVLLVLAVSPVPSAGPQAEAAVRQPELVVEPSAAVAPTTVQLSGRCDVVTDEYGDWTPETVTISLEPTGASRTQDVAADGSFAGPFPVPAGAAVGEQTFRTDCDGETPFTVLPAPTLELSPVSGRVGSEVTASGTCRQAEVERDPDVLLDGTTLVTAVLDDVSGRFGPVTFPVPEGTGLGPQEFTTSCGGSSTFTVVPAPSPPTVPPTTPPGGGEELVVVPDLTGLTEQEAIAALGSALALANPTGAEGRVVRQDPPPGSRVPAGTVVTVALEPASAERADEPVPTAAIVVGGLVLAGLLVWLGTALHIGRGSRRVGRERRWLDEHVDVAASPADPLLSDPPTGPVPGLHLDLEVVREPGEGPLHTVGGPA